MFGSIKKATVAGAILAVGALGAPTMASAVTATPALVAPETQAKVSSVAANGVASAQARVFTGSVSLTNPAIPVTVTCTMSATVSVALAGTATVSGITFTPTPCPTSIAGCSATAVAGPTPNNTWGARLITWPGATAPVSGTYAKINANFTNTFSGSCGPIPVGVPLNYTGELWTRLGVASGSLITSAVVTSPKNIVNNPATGNATIAGTLTRGGAALYSTM